MKLRFLKSSIRKTFIYYFYLKYKQSKVTDGKTRLNILKTFPLFEAHGFGYYNIRAKLTIQSINQVIPSLSDFAKLSDENVEFKKKLPAF